MSGLARRVQRNAARELKHRRLVKARTIRGVVDGLRARGAEAVGMQPRATEGDILLAQVAIAGPMRRTPNAVQAGTHGALWRARH